MTKLRTVNAKTFKDLLELIEGIHATPGWKKGDELVYRGHPNASWALAPSVFRFADERKRLNPRGIKQIESDIYYLFSTRMAPKLGVDHSGWDYLFHMQHHGVPTRLLDWTESAGKAVWFACGSVEGKRVKEERPCLWVLNASRLNDESWGFPGSIDPDYLTYYNDTYKNIVANSYNYKFKRPIAIYPNYLNERMHAQSGLFTVFGDRLKALEQQCPQALVKIVIGPACEREAIRYSRFYGASAYSIYPDVQGLCSYINTEV